MSLNMNAMMQVLNSWNAFKANHPKFPMFLDALKHTGIKEGTIIAVSVTDPDGKVMETNIKVSASDIELFNSLKDIR